MYYCNLDSYSPSIIVAREPKLWQLKRKLSVMECKRLQGFDDAFKINVSVAQAKKQLGNSVPIPVVKSVAQAMLSAYKKNKLPEKQLLLL